MYQGKNLIWFRDKLLSNLNIVDGVKITFITQLIDKDRDDGIESSFNNYFIIKEFETDYKEKNTNQQSGKQSSWPLPSIIVGVIDLLLLAAAIITFSLFFLTNLISSIVVPIVLTILFVAFTILFFLGNNSLPKSCLGKINLRTGLDEKEKGIEKEKNNGPKKEKDEEEKIK